MLSAFLSSHWEIGAFQEAKTINGGSNAETLLISAELGRFVLRRCRDCSSAEKEWRIHTALLPKLSVPEILLTRDFRPFAVHDNTVYQLQCFLHGNVLETPNEYISRTLANAVSALHHELQALDVDGEDRFALHSCLSSDNRKTLSERYGLNAESVAYYTKLDGHRQQLIHGDLSLRNVLLSGDDIHFLDFSEARMGDPRFDFAGLLCSLLLKTPSARRRAIAESFLEGCMTAGALLGRDELLPFMELWFVRGICNCINAGNDSAADRSMVLMREICGAFEDS